MRIDETRRTAKLGVADVEGEAPESGGRSQLIGTLSTFVARLPQPLQRWLPPDLPSALLLLAYSWTALVGVLLVYSAIVGWQEYLGELVVYVPIAVVGLAGLWRGRSLFVLVPAAVIWFTLAVLYVLAEGTSALFIPASFVACLVVAGWSVVLRFRRSQHQASQARRTVNQLGWDLYRLSTEPPITDQSVDRVTAFPGLRVGEVERHFDEVTFGAIQGGMQHSFRIKGTSSSVHGMPQEVFLADTASWMRMVGTGVSTVQLGMDGRTSADLTDDAFIAVFEKPQAEGVDTVRVVVPSARQARAYVSQLLQLWSSQLVLNSAQELMLRRYAGAIIQSVSSDSSYVGDRLGAILRMPAAERPLVTVIGEPLNQHAVLGGAVRFGEGGLLYQLFPLALVRALAALMEGRPLPLPPIQLPPVGPSAPEQSVEEARPTADAAAANGHVSQVVIRTLGGFRVSADGVDVTASLLDRKVLAFLWLQLLARRVRNPHDTITRASLADELSPGLDGSTQRSRLRGRLSELRNELPPPIGKLVEVSGERVGLNLANSEVDAIELLERAVAFARTNGVLSPEQLAAAEALASKSDGIFLPEWEDIEQHVNSGRGAGGEVIADLRRRLAGAQATLLRVLGTGYLSHGKAESAVSPLERALELSPDDESIARSLVAACLQTGRMARAEELRKDFALV